MGGYPISDDDVWNIAERTQKELNVLRSYPEDSGSVAVPAITSSEERDVYSEAHHLTSAEIDERSALVDKAADYLTTADKWNAAHGVPPALRDDLYAKLYHTWQRMRILQRRIEARMAADFKSGMHQQAHLKALGPDAAGAWSFQDGGQPVLVLPAMYSLNVAEDRGDERAGRPGGTSVFSKLGAGGSGMGAFAERNRGGAGNPFPHSKKPGRGGLPGGPTNPPPKKSTTGGAAVQPKDNSNDSKGLAQSSRSDVVFTSGGGPGASTGATTTAGSSTKDASKSTDKSQERASGQSKDVTPTSTSGPNPTGTSGATGTSGSSGGTSTARGGSSQSGGQGGNTPTTPGQSSTTLTRKEQKEQEAKEDQKTDKEKDKEAKRKHGGGGSMPNPEDSGGGGEGPRVSGGGPNPENTGVAVGRADLRVPARLRFSTMPNPESSAAFAGGEDDGGFAPGDAAAPRFFTPQTFRYRIPGALGDRPSDEGGTMTGGGTGGPRAYDAYPDPESSGGVGPKARYERPNPEDTGSPHGPSARTAISWSSATRNRMV